MMPSVMKERPPFVQFRYMEVGRNVEASEAAGRLIPNVVLMACITPHGSKDCFEQPAEEWIAKIRAKASQGEYNPEHVQFFAAQLKGFKDGEELPRQGTPIKTWQRGTPEQRARLHAIGYTTVEDLAALPDASVNTIGLDGRILRDEARAFIKEAKEVGTVAAENADLRSKLIAATTRNSEQQAMIDSLIARIERLESGDPAPKKRGN